MQESALVERRARRKAAKAFSGSKLHGCFRRGLGSRKFSVVRQRAKLRFGEMDVFWTISPKRWFWTIHRFGEMDGPKNAGSKHPTANMPNTGKHAWEARSRGAKKEPSDLYQTVVGAPRRDVWLCWGADVASGDERSG